MNLGIFNYIAAIPKESQLKYLFILAFALFFATTLFIVKVPHIAGLLLGVALVIFMQDRDASKIGDFNREMEFKLNTIKRLIRSSKKARPGPIKQRDLINDPKHLHKDPDLINLFFNIQDFQKYNPAAYEQMVHATDNVLQLHDDLIKFDKIKGTEFEDGQLRRGASACGQNIEVADQFIADALNHYHSLIVALPSNVVVDEKFNNNQTRFHLLLRRHRDDMYRRCKRFYDHTGYFNQRKVLRNSGPRPMNPNAGPFDYYN